MRGGNCVLHIGEESAALQHLLCARFRRNRIGKEKNAAVKKFEALEVREPDPPVHWPSMIWESLPVS